MSAWNETRNYYSSQLKWIRLDWHPTEDRNALTRHNEKNSLSYFIQEQDDHENPTNLHRFPRRLQNLCHFLSISKKDSYRNRYPDHDRDIVQCSTCVVHYKCLFFVYTFFLSSSPLSRCGFSLEQLQMQRTTGIISLFTSWADLYLQQLV